MQAVSQFRSQQQPTFGGQRVHNTQAAESLNAMKAVQFGQDDLKITANASPKAKSTARKLLWPSVAIVGGLGITFATAGLFHWVGVPLMLWGAYKAYKALK